MKQFVYNSDANRVETRSLIPFEGHKIPVKKPINKNVSPNTIANDSDPTFYSEAYLQAVKIVNNKLSSLYRLTGAYAYKRMLSDLYIDRLFIENAESKTEALAHYIEERDSIKAKLTDSKLDDKVKTELINDRNRLTDYIQEIEKDLHVTSKSYDLVMTAYSVLYEYSVKGISTDDIIEIDSKGKEITPYLLACRKVNNDLDRHKSYDTELKLGAKIGVNGLTQAQNKAFYSDETNPVRHNEKIEAFYKNLTKNERDILPLLMQGKSVREIADILNVSKSTIDRRIQAMKKKAKQSKEE